MVEEDAEARLSALAQCVILADVYYTVSEGVSSPMRERTCEMGRDLGRQKPSIAMNRIKLTKGPCGQRLALFVLAWSQNIRNVTLTKLIAR